jgi:PhzF family phenazine biosynthesis protein
VAEVLHYTAFSDSPEGGNPAGVVLDAGGLDDDAMRAIAAEVGYSETAFLLPEDGGGFEVRYFSPMAEVAFCGHATIAAAVAHSERHGPGELVFRTLGGEVPVTVREEEEGRLMATLRSLVPTVAPLAAADLDEILAALGWGPADLDPGLPPRVAFAGVHHPVIAAATRERLAALDYDFARLGALMAARDWTTVQLVWCEDGATFHARDPFPPAGVVEDPATGAAAAALGGYLRALRLIDPPARFTVHQGEDMERPSTLVVDVPAGDDTGIGVSGAAVPLPTASPRPAPARDR